MSIITYQVVTNSSSLNIREKPSTTDSAIIGSIPKGSTCTSESQSNGWAKISYNGVIGYASMSYLKEISKSEPVQEPSPTISTGSSNPSSLEGPIDQTGGMSFSEYQSYINSTSLNKENELFTRYTRALGCPPQFNKWVDIQYNNSLGPGQGRRISETLFSNPSILSLCPGNVTYLPGFSSKEKDIFWEKVKDRLSGQDSEDDLINGKLYEFRSAYKEYIDIVNLLCRSTALYLGLGDVIMPDSSVPLKNFDYAYWTTSKWQQNTGSYKDIFREANMIKETIVSDASYVHFFVTQQGTSVTESIDTSTTSSSLESLFESSGLTGISRDLNFLFGGALDSNSGFGEDVKSTIDSFSAGSGFLKSFGKLAKNFLSGGRIIFPQMIENVAFSKAMTATLKFESLYGDPLSVFLRCYVPYMHILALAMPKQLSENMYTYPFLVRAFQKSQCNFDLAVITNLRMNRGGQEMTSWTIDGLPTELEISFDITPLYTTLMSSSVIHPFRFLQNTALTEYLATMCGVDLKANNLHAKLDIAETMLIGSLKETLKPVNLARKIIDTKLANTLSNIFKFTN